jgi:hypothetical protein
VGSRQIAGGAWLPDSPHEAITPKERGEEDSSFPWHNIFIVPHVNPSPRFLIMKFLEYNVTDALKYVPFCISKSAKQGLS